MSPSYVIHDLVMSNTVWLSENLVLAFRRFGAVERALAVYRRLKLRRRADVSSSTRSFCSTTNTSTTASYTISSRVFSSAKRPFTSDTSTHSVFTTFLAINLFNVSLPVQSKNGTLLLFLFNRRLNTIWPSFKLVAEVKRHSKLR